jgi:hypothetical protein
MKKEVYYPISQKQLGRYVAISKLTVKEAAKSLGLSTRQILRLKKGVKTSGANALLHKNSGRKPHHAINECLREKIIALMKSHPYSDANFYHFQELVMSNIICQLTGSSVYQFCLARRSNMKI